MQLIFQALCCVFWLGLYVARTYVNDDADETRLLNPVELVALVFFCIFVIDYVISLLIAEDRCGPLHILFLPWRLDPSLVLFRRLFILLLPQVTIRCVVE